MPFASVVPQEVIDDFLRHGSNTTNSRMHIIATLYPWYTTDTSWLTDKARDVFAGILRREYHGGYGLIVDGIKYAAWYDADGIRLCRGSSARYAPFAQTVPWDAALERIWRLYGDGQFATNVEAVEAHGNECREIALALLYLYYDRSEDCPEKYLSTITPYVSGAYSDNQVRLSEALSDANKAFEVKKDLDAFIDAYRGNPSFLRFHYHDISQIRRRFESLLVSWENAIPQTATELPHTPFITEDEIDVAVTTRGSGFEGGKKRVYDFFAAQPNHDAKSKAEFLKSEYGTGGHSHALSGTNNSWADHNTKGLRFRKGDCPDVLISWPNLAKRIETLIRMNRFLTSEEQAKADAIRDAHYEPEEDIPEEPETESPTDTPKTDSKPVAEEAQIVAEAEQQAAAEPVLPSTAQKPSRTRVARNYRCFARLFPEIAAKEYRYMELRGADGLMPLHLQWISDDEIAISHTYELNGDLAYDPEMTFRVDNENGTLEPLTFRQDGSLAVYQEVYPEPGMWRPKLRNELSAFTESWFRNIEDQGRVPFRAITERNGEDVAYTFAESGQPMPETTDVINDGANEPAAAEPPIPREMTQEEINAALQAWNGRIESKRAVVRYMESHARERETAAWLAQEFGGTPDNPLTLITPTGDAETSLPWPKVQRRIAQLIREDRFYTEQELDNFDDVDPVAIRESLAQSGIVNGELVDPAALDRNPFIQQVMAVADSIGQAEEAARMEETSSERQAFEIKSLADLKRHISVGTEIETTYHWKHPDLVGLTRVVTKVQTNGFYCKIKDQPQHKWSVCNNGEGIFSDFQKADTYRFRSTPKGTSIQVLDRHDPQHETVLLEMMVYPGSGMERDIPDPTVKIKLPPVLNATHPRWPVDVGDTVYLEDGKAFLVEHLADSHIQLRDPTLVYPILRSESFERFHRLLERFPQGIAEDVSVSAEDVGTTYEPIQVNNGGEQSEIVVRTVRNSPPREPIRVSAENFRITDDHLGEGGPKAKFRANLDAITTLKRIEAEGRIATLEEQEALSSYVGWGGLADAFDDSKADWIKEYAELKAALTPEEYAAARASTLNAHYTSPTVIRAIYDALGNMGFTTGNILEPACGVGNFFGCLPSEMSDSRLYGVELDSLSGRIAKQLYPNANITVAGFETTDRRDFYDVAVGNVPFGQYQVNDRAYNKLGFSIHNYFFAKALDQVRPGGVVAFVTSRYTMDAKDSTVRRYLAQRAELLGAIRLPNNAFRANAGTDVVSDIIFLQKRERPSMEQPDWLFTAKNIPDNAPAKDGDMITFTTGYPAKEYTAEVIEVGRGYANVPFYRGKNEEREFSYIDPASVTGIERKSDFVYEINQYFLDHPEMVLGEAASESTQYGRMEYTVAPKEGISLVDQLHEAVGNLQGTYLPFEQPDLEPESNTIQWMPADPTVRNNSYTLIDGKLWFRENSIMRRIDVSATLESRMKGMVELRDCMRSLLDLELDEYATEEEISLKQTELSRLYDAFTARYGQINDRSNELAFAEDPAYFLICSLEEQSRDGKAYHKAVDIFTKRTIKAQRSIDHVDTAADALAVSIGQKACVDLPFMAQLMGGEEYIPQIVEDLHGVIFKDPESGPFDHAEGGAHWDKGWQPADEYLSGNVRIKLRQAEAVSKNDPFFEINAEALKRAQPKDLDASEIEARIGSTWIAPEIFEQFMMETFKTPRYLQNYMHIRFSPHTAEWFIEGKKQIGYDDMTANNRYGTSKANAYQILEDSLNLRDVRVYDTIDDKRVLNAKETTLAAQKQQAIREAFKDWLWKDPERREKLVRQYNEEMNSTRPREYDGKHLVFSGINPDIVLREHQLNAIAHAIYGGNTLLAHEVGAGKTFEMVAAAMESKRLGLCNKSLFVVPNHLVNQWASEFLRLYPGANILVTAKRDFEPARRKKFCARIATGDYDAVIIGQSQFEKIPISEERQRMILERQIEDITEAIQDVSSERGARFTVKQLEKTKKGLEARLEKLQGSDRKDDVVTFEELGIDRLFVDESDNYKNLFLYTKMRNVAGLSTSDAQKSSDMFNKCRYLDELTGNRGVIFATGTPISNSMTEMFTIHRYLQYDRLQEMSMGHFDCWASRFGETTTALELAPEGTGYRARTRFAKFFNLPELMTFFKEVADIKTADQLNLPTPEVEYHNIVAQPTEIQKELVQTLSKRASKVHSGAVDPKEDNMLKITSDGRKLGLDQRLMDPLLPDAPGTKVNLCVENILKYWRQGEADKLTQLVFCDVSTPTGRSSGRDDLPEDVEPPFTNIYQDIRRKLIKGGMPAEQIAFIHDADTEKRKEELFSKMRSGQVRVLIGSTAKMGAGTNVQDRLIASHDLDCPWRPRDLTQRKGRIERQGNTNSKVHVCRYVTEGTFDAYLWQTVENKQKFISQVMTSKSPVRTCDDMDETALSFAEIKALCAGDPRIKERMDLDVEVSKLRLMKADHNSNHYRIQDMILRYYPAKIEEAQAEIRGLEEDMQTLAAHPLPMTEDFVGMEVRGDWLSDKKNAGAALISACQEMVSKESVKLGTYRGFDVLGSYDTWERQYRLTMKGRAAHSLTLGADPIGNFTRMENALAKMPDRLNTARAELANYQKQMETAAVEVQKPWPFEQELADKTARLIELDMALNLDKDHGGRQEPECKKKHYEEVI